MSNGIRVQLFVQGYRPMWVTFSALPRVGDMVIGQVWGARKGTHGTGYPTQYVDRVTWFLDGGIAKPGVWLSPRAEEAAA